MVKRKKGVRDNSHFGREHRRLISFARVNNKKDSLIEVGRLRRKFPRRGRGKPHWVGDYKNYPVSNIYWDYGICPPRVLDRDGDRAVNWEDCNPRNKYQQGFIRNVLSRITGSKKQSDPSLGTIYLKPSESSQASKIAKQSGATVQVVGGSVSNPVIISTTTPSGRTTNTVSGGGSGSSSILRSGSIREILNNQATEVRNLEEAKKQAQTQEEARNIQFAINQAKSNKIQISQEADLRREIQRLDRERLNAQSKAQLDKILQDKKEREIELYQSRSGVTSYNKKIALETYKAQQEYNSYLNNQVASLQAQVDAGSISVDKANKLLQERAETKADQVNKNLNSKISTISVPNALKVPVNTVEAVAPPKGLLNKGITALKNIPVKQTSIKDPALQTQLRGFKELGIGVGIGALSFVKGIVDLPKTLVTLVKNPSLIKELPASVIQSGAEIGESLKLSPERTLARVGTELFLMNKGGEIIKRVSGPSKAKLLSKLDSAGVVSRIELKIIRGKIPKIVLRIKSVEDSLKPVPTKKNIGNVAKDISKLIPKTVSKAQATKLINSSESIIRSFLRSKTVLKELTRKYPKKIRFTVREIRTIRSYPKLKTAIKRDVFAKYGVQAVRKTGQVVKKGGRRIGGVKVGRKEFRSFKEAEVEFNKLKRLGKFVKKIENKGGVGRVERLSKRPVTAQELEYFKIGRKIPSQLLRNVKQVEVTTFTQKFSARVPVLKRFGDKEGFWRTIIKDKEFYQNSVSFSLYKKGGKSVGTITFNTISSKPITRFRSLTNALKWGTNKEVVLSKLTGNSFVRSFVLSARGRKITAREFLSKIKVKPNGDFQDLLIYTKKIPSVTTRGNIKKQFRESIPVSVTRGRIKKTRLPPTVTRLKLGKGYVKIIQKGKVVKAIRTKSIINPVIIDTSKIDTVVRELNSLKNKALSQARLKRVKQFKRLVDDIKTSRPFVLNGNKKVIISESRLKQLNKIAKETKGLKESLAGRSIPTRLRVTRRVEGVKQLRKLKQAEQSLKKLRGKLIKRNALDVGMRTAIAQSLLLSNRLKQNLKSGQVLVTDQKTKQIQKSIQKSLQTSKSKLGLKSISVLRLEFPILSIPTIPRTIRPRVPTTKPPKIRFPSNKREDLKFKTFSKPVKIFSIVVRKRRKNIILNDRLTERDALNFMAYELDTQLLRSARLRPLGNSKRARLISEKYNGAFERRKRKLRQFKIKGKKRIPIRGFIEHKRFALDTPGEKAQLRRLQRGRFARKRKITPSHRKELLRRLAKARKVRQRNLRRGRR